jgi:hypothetical protein
MANNRNPATRDRGASGSVDAAKLNAPDDRVSTAIVKSWRDVLPIHPAADAYPLLDRRDLIDLGDDIRRNGLLYLVTLSSDGQLCDGRNRLDAMEAAGIEIVFDDSMFERLPPDADLDAWIASANLFRRHLTLEQRAEKVAALIEAHCGKSDLQIAKMAGVSHPTIAKARAKLEASGALKPLSTRTDTKGRKQPAKKKRRTEDDFRRDMQEKKAAAVATAMPGDIGPMLPADPPPVIEKAVNLIITAWDRCDEHRLEFVKQRRVEIARVIEAAKIELPTRPAPPVAPESEAAAS